MNEAVTEDPVPSAPTVPDVPAALIPLTPKFRADEHDLYLKRIEAALDDDSEAAPKNIALTGSYGSGKSSVIEGLLKKRRYRPIRISLSTINPKKVVDGKEEEALAISNVIQKEIVKQILYREKVSKMSGSRFRRVDKFHWFGAIWLALGLSTAIAAVSYLNGWTERFELLVTAHQAPLALAAAAAVAVLAVGLVGIQRIFHGRIRVKGLSAGPAQLELKEEESAFDRYLDEIVYFFAVSKCTAAIFEDLDRFDRIEIYEELRALNVLLNSSRQLHRPVRFIYAMRDSLFEEIGENGAEGDSDPSSGLEDKNPESAALRKLIKKAAERAKFFDLVLPMVPFATMRTAIDLWREELPDSTDISLRAIQVAAAHVQDMRLIRNVRNEYLVFTEELARNGLGGIRPDSVFGLMLYKNVYLEDFEAIRHGASLLDRVESIRQDAVTSALTEWEESTRTALSQSTLDQRRQDRAQAAGRRMFDGIARSFKVSSRPMPTISLRIGSTTYSSDDALEPDFWEQLEAAAWELEIGQGNPPTRTASVSLADIEAWIGYNPATVDWSEAVAEEQGEDTFEAELLARAEISDLLEKDLLSATQRSKLESDVREQVKSELAWELIAGGFIDQNFSLYVSRFYGRVITANAMNYVIHVVQKGRYSPFAALEGSADAEAVMNVVGTDFLTTHSGLNVGLFDALADDDRLSAALKLVGQSSQAEGFLDAYLSTGSRAERVIERLSSMWGGVFAYLLREETPQDQIVELMNAALRGVGPEVEYSGAPGFAPFIEEHQDGLAVLHGNEESNASALAALFAAENVEVEDLAALSPNIRSETFKVGAFKVNSVNLRAGLGESSAWALDSVPSDASGALDKLIRELDSYLEALPRSTSPLNNQTDLPIYVSKIQALRDNGALTRVLRRSSRHLRANDISKYPQATWQTLALERRVVSTPSNVLAYGRAFGLDKPISRLVSDTAPPVKSPLSPVESRELAILIVLDKDIAKTKRAKWVKALQPTTPLLMTELASAEGEVIPYLVANGCVEDTDATFIALRDRPWAARELLIKKSTDFLSYLPSMGLLDSEVFAIFEGKAIAISVKVEIINALAAIPVKLTPRSATSVAKFFLGNHVTLKWIVMDMLIASRASADLLVEILVRFQYKLPRLTDCLALMLPPWRELSGRAARKPLVADNPMTVRLLSVLEQAGVVSSWDGAKNNQLRVQVRKST